MAEMARVDVEAFPTLAEWLRQPQNEFRERVDSLAARARQEAAPAAQKGLQMATQLLPVLYRNYGGQS